MKDVVRALSANQALGGTKMKPSSVVYWLRCVLAVVAGFANHYFHVGESAFGELAIFMAIGLAFVFYALSFVIVRYLLRYGDVELKGKNRRITLGGGTFIVIWVMVVVLLESMYESR